MWSIIIRVFLTGPCNRETENFLLEEFQKAYKKKRTLSWALKIFFLIGITIKKFFIRIFQIVNWVRAFQTKAQAEQRRED